MGVISFFDLFIVLGAMFEAFDETKWVSPHRSTHRTG